MSQTIVTASDWVCNDPEVSFLDWDLTEVQEVLDSLQESSVPDLFHCELLQQRTLRCADILSQYIGKLITIVSYLEAKVSAKKAEVARNYNSPEGRTTLDMKKWASESSDVVLKEASNLAKAKGFKSVLDKRYEIVIKAHHHYKDMAAGLRKSTALGYVQSSQD